MQNLLPESDKTGIVCVIENSQGQQYTYKINGPEAEFLGNGAIVEREYNDLRISADYTSFEDSSENGWYTGVQVDTDHISYKIHIYPSKEFEESYMTDKPIVYAVSIFAVFLFTVSIFILYDCYVERRQRIVMNNAVKSNAVVSSLFPAQVRDQIMDNAVQKQQEQQKPSKKDSMLGTSNHNMKSFMTEYHANKDEKASGRPIADLFENTTIFFADLAGFTAWSSKRTPTEVFELLEALYGAFDKIALKRSVFKVETIGDCYGKCLFCFNY